MAYSTREPIGERNTFHANREFTAAVRAKATELEAIFDEVGADMAKAEAKLKALGFGKDSLGQWFAKGELIPYPSKKSADPMGR
jgi:hypothetical protein